MSNLDTFLAFGIASVTASVLCLIEIETYFRERKVTIGQILTHGPAASFVIANGLAAAVVFAWGAGYISGHPNPNYLGPVGEFLKSNNIYSVAVAVAFFTPLLIRSRLFEIGEGENKVDVGFEQIYAWAKRKVFAELGRSCGLKKKVASTEIARKFSDNRFETQVFEGLEEYVGDFLTVSKADEIKDKYLTGLQELAGFYENDRTSESYRQSVVKLAMDIVGLKAVHQYFKTVSVRQPKNPAEGSEVANRTMP